LVGIAGFVRGEEKVTWSEKTARRAIGEEVYNQQNEFLNNKVVRPVLAKLRCWCEVTLTWAVCR
jgi:hypothetical protein